MPLPNRGLFSIGLGDPRTTRACDLEGFGFDEHGTEIGSRFSICHGTPDVPDAVGRDGEHFS
jgi:hypothetical protein